MAITITCLDDANHTISSSKKILSRQGELGETITFSLPSTLNTAYPRAWIMIQQPDGQLYYIDNGSGAGFTWPNPYTFTYDIGDRDTMLSSDGTLGIQIVLRDATPPAQTVEWRSRILYLTIEGSILSNVDSGGSLIDSLSSGTLNRLADIQYDSLADGDLLYRDTATGKWRNITLVDGLNITHILNKLTGELTLSSTATISSNASDVLLADTAGRITSTQVEGAIAEIAGSGRTTESLANIGLLSSLTTTEKGTVVGSINEVNEQLAQIAYNVKNFGAVGDGVTNDTQAFKDAFSFALAPVKTILIPAGNYYIDDTINLMSDTEVRFVGTVLEKVVGKPLFLASNKKNVHFVNPKITGEGAGETYVINQESIFFNYCENVSVNNGEFKEINGRNAVLFFGSVDIEASGNNIDKYSYGGIVCLQGCKNVRIYNNKIVNCSNNTTPNIYPIMLSGYDGTVAGYPMAENIWCHGNYIDNLFPYWEGIDAHGGKNIHVYNNIVKGSYTGIALMSMSDASWYVQDIFVHDNHCIAPIQNGGRAISNNGIVITGANGIILNGHVHHNTIVDYGKLTTSTTDLGSVKLNNVNGLKVESNYFNNSKGFGVRLTGACKNVDIVGNTFDGVQGVGAYGVYFDNTAHEVNIEGNSFKNMEGLLRKPVSSTDPANTLIRIRNNTIGSGIAYNPIGLYTLPDKQATRPDLAGCKVGKIGDIVYNSAPATGLDIGWICTASGDGVTAGTWKSIGVVT